MTTFIETPRFPEEVSAWALGGPMYQTIIAAAGSGAETRNQVWTYPLGKWDISAGLRTIANAQATIAFHRCVAGRALGFRMKDPLDNADNGAGVMGTGGIGTGLPTYQLYKNYVVGSTTANRKISKPVSLGLVIKRNGVTQTAGSSAGNYAVDSTTGIVTFVADATANVSNIVVGATTQVTMSANIGNLGVGGLLYLTGLGGANASVVNNQAFTVTAHANTIYTLSVNTANMTITASGSGAAYPQPSDTLTWTGSFDVPVRFDDDWLQLQYDTGGLLQYNQIKVTELRL